MNTLTNSLADLVTITLIQRLKGIDAQKINLPSQTSIIIKQEIEIYRLGSSII
jgi:hypothetical protein